MIYRTVPGPEENQEIEIKIYRPKEAAGPPACVSGRPDGLLEGLELDV